MVTKLAWDRHMAIIESNRETDPIAKLIHESKRMDDKEPTIRARNRSVKLICGELTATILEQAYWLASTLVCPPDQLWAHKSTIPLVKALRDSFSVIPHNLSEFRGDFHYRHALIRPGRTVAPGQLIFYHWNRDHNKVYQDVTILSQNI